MKKLLITILFLSLSFFASAGFVLTVDAELSAPDVSINLTSGAHDFSLQSASPIYFDTYYLILYPKTAAYFIQNIVGIFPVDPSPWENIDVLYIEPSLIPKSHIEFAVQFNGPAADFAVVNPDFDPVITWHLVPEPTSLLLLGLSGLALRKRIK